MKYYLDTEFNGFGGELISIALAPEQKSKPSLYLVIDFQSEPVPWVAQNVIPQLGDHPRVSREVAARTIANYLMGDETVPVVIADWPEDLSQMLMLAILGPGRMVNMPDVAYRYVSLPGFNAADHSDIPHNALSDAEALRDYCEES